MQVELWVILLTCSTQTSQFENEKVEFDKPSELLKMENGMFRSLVDESEDRDLLYSIASLAGKA